MSVLARPEFRLPLAVLASIVAGLIVPEYGALIWGIGIAIGLAKIVRDSAHKILQGHWSLDYIAFLAMVVAPFADQFFAGAIVALMITGGEALDEYASARAESALKALVERIPKSCTIRAADGSTYEKAIQDVQGGEHIIVRGGELIPLDGTLLSAQADISEANLTGEAIPLTRTTGAFIKSGSVNEGEAIALRVEGTLETSTYMRIVHLVDEAKKHQAPVVRLAERVNFPFTAIALSLAGIAYFISGELSRALAVLVIATPCPLIIAAPVAFIGGLSRAARSNIIVKRPATLEELSRSHTVFFDKTGTLTLGEPDLQRIEVLDATMAELEILAIAGAIEFHSIHPLARAIVAARIARQAPSHEAHEVHETIGKGIEGAVEGKRYTVTKSPVSEGGISLSLLRGEMEIARLHFEDQMKENVQHLFERLRALGVHMEILTGDREENAQRLFGRFGIPIRAHMTPETKFAVINEAKKRGETVVMVGDGLNDAPALAEANVGIVFSGTENSAAIEAADAVILGRDVTLVVELFDTAKRSMRVAKQSIWGGVALSSIGMLAAVAGYVPPIWGALIQEGIDVVVILNSLRAAAARKR